MAFCEILDIMTARHLNPADSLLLVSLGLGGQYGWEVLVPVGMWRAESNPRRGITWLTWNQLAQRNHLVDVPSALRPGTGRTFSDCHTVSACPPRRSVQPLKSCKSQGAPHSNGARLLANVVARQ
jgi:hypothetical protein